MPTVPAVKPTPIKPSEFKAVIPTADDTVAQAIVKVFIRFPILFYRWFSYTYRADMTFSDEVKAALCKVASECP